MYKLSREAKTLKNELKNSLKISDIRKESYGFRFRTTKKVKRIRYCY